MQPHSFQFVSKKFSKVSYSRMCLCVPTVIWDVFHKLDAADGNEEGRFLAAKGERFFNADSILGISRLMQGVA